MGDVYIKLRVLRGKVRNGGKQEIHSGGWPICQRPQSIDCRNLSSGRGFHPVGTRFGAGLRPRAVSLHALYLYSLHDGPRTELSAVGRTL